VEVETDRLRLRPLATSDADGLLRLHRDPEMMRYFGDGHTYREDQSRSWLDWHVAMWDLEGYGFWAVEHQVDGAFIGWLGVTKVWDPPELLPASEVGWFIDRRYWGQGLATEGAGEALRFAFGPLGLPRVIARYNADNVASGRVMEKIGMKLWRELPHADVPGATARIYEKYAQ
jgi:RimJ/RimL family protein N-acetyltransferase